MRTKAYLSFAILGFALGFFFYLVYPYLLEIGIRILGSILKDERIVGAVIAGIAGIITTLAVVLMWSFLSD
jgi:hypothetical protein